MFQADFIIKPSIDIKRTLELLRLEPPDGKSDYEQFTSLCLLLSGEKTTLPNIRNANYVSSFMQFTAITIGLNFQHVGTLKVIDFYKQVRLWTGSVFEWKNEIANYLCKRNTEDDARIFYSGAMQLLKRDVFTHLFDDFIEEKQNDGSYLLRRRS